jgi:manganese/iron transport system ATP-binding protein
MPTLFHQRVRHDVLAPSLELEHVSVSYDGAAALDDVTFTVHRGDQVAVVGPNGAGKSTLFNVIAGILKPQRGAVRVYGSGPHKHICVGYVPQRNRIDWRFPVTVGDTVMMGRIGKMGLLRWPSRRDRRIVAGALAQVEMQNYAQRQIGELSGGQQQRVFLARALAQEAELLLLDEPLAGLDMPAQEAFLNILDALRNSGITMLIATHDLNQAADQFSRIMLLNHRLVAFGGPQEVLTEAALAQAYGGQMHVVHTEQGVVMVTDTCCGGGRPPVGQVLGSDGRVLKRSEREASIIGAQEGGRTWKG